MAISLPWWMLWIQSCSEPREIEILTRSLMSQFDQFVKLNKKIPPEILSSLASIDEPIRLADTISAHLPLKIDEKQTLLETIDLKQRLEYLMTYIESEIDLLQMEKRIRNRVKRKMEEEHENIISINKKKR